MLIRVSKRVEEKTLEINVCDNIIDNLRSSNPLFRNAYWQGITLRLERYTGLDVKLEVGEYNSYIMLGLQFKRVMRRSYDYQRGEAYYLFEINNNSANDQHLFLWITSRLLHTLYPNKFVFIGYAFPMFLYHYEMSMVSPDFLQRTVFVDAIGIPISKLDRLSHEVYVYERTLDIIVASKEKVKVTENIYVGKELIEKLVYVKKDEILSINDIRKISRENVLKVINELEGIVAPDVAEYIRRKIDKGWQTTIGTVLIPAKVK